MTTTSIAHVCAETVAILLDSREIIDFISELDFLKWTGRPGYSTRTLMGVVLVKSMYGQSTWTKTLALVKDHAGLRAAIGCVNDQDVPSIDAVYRFIRKLSLYEGQRQACIDAVLRGWTRSSQIWGKTLPSMVLTYRPTRTGSDL